MESILRDKTNSPVGAKSAFSSKIPAAVKSSSLLKHSISSIKPSFNSLSWLDKENPDNFQDIEYMHREGVDPADSMEQGHAKTSPAPLNTGRHSPQYVHDVVDEELSQKRVKIDGSDDGSDYLREIALDLENAKEIMNENVEKTINRETQLGELSDRARMAFYPFY
ncbi:hypothetical protein DI09_24p190 [Mitosporidium daphniae]|uniref:Uncharacterized protein n=1 Tax=Mitosporidium daphniae TaxID=1485682 RepID=A0A098VS86_9MICR|nr:uncharacterized protein DI09_24p190 [Mitosporidium daphniae]KGG51898.1 hypothetical protein DI09_24p190 [Mitosporidium daphniae]|eukprot:XP_013238325.1 uncharacterized protein DI09_24p190 [Mitosporidium daphniae]